MIVILVGSPFAGKTFLLKKLQDKGVKVFNADSYIRKIYQKGEKGYELIAQTLGEDFVNDKEVDREKIRNYLLKNEDKLAYLNEIIHPLIFDYLKGKDNYVAELPIIKKTPVKFNYDAIILVKADLQTIKKRMRDKNYPLNPFINNLIDKWDNDIEYDYVVDTSNGVSDSVVNNIISKFKLTTEY